MPVELAEGSGTSRPRDPAGRGGGHLAPPPSRGNPRRSTAVRSPMRLLILLVCLLSPPSLAEPPLPELQAPLKLVVKKAERVVEVYSAGVLARSYPVGLGFAPEGDKERQGDGKTPEGRFTVARRVPKSQYYKAWLLDYPRPEDAARGEAAGLVDARTAKRIVDAHAAGKVPPQYTELGGLIELHGRGSGSDWTLGCVALDDAAIDELWPHVRVGTEIVIQP